MPTGSSQELRVEAVIPEEVPSSSSSSGRRAPEEESSDSAPELSAWESSSLQSCEVSTSGSLLAWAACEASWSIRF